MPIVKDKVSECTAFLYFTDHPTLPINSHTCITVGKSLGLWAATRSSDSMTTIKAIRPGLVNLEKIIYYVSVQFLKLEIVAIDEQNQYIYIIYIYIFFF